MGKTKEKKLVYCMCSLGGCNLGWQNGPVQWTNYILAIKHNVNKEFKYPNPRVRCTEHEELAILVQSFSSFAVLKNRLFFICGNKKDKGGRCDFVKSADFQLGSIDGKNLAAWYRLDEKRKVKDNKQA